MNLSCGARTIKYLIFTFNFLFVITGIVLIAVGASIVTVYSDYHLFLSGNYFSLPNLLIATGCLIFVISFLGCYGAMKQSWIMLMAFSVLLGMIFIFEFSAGIAGYVLRDETSSYLETTLRENMRYYNNDSDITALWDSIQEEFQCCGVTNYTDWGNLYKQKLPISCCPPKSGEIGTFYCNVMQSSDTVTPTTATTPTIPATKPTDAPTRSLNESRRKRDLRDNSTTSNSTTPTTYPPTSTFPYSIGCETAFGDFVRAHAVDIGGIGFALAVLQLVGIVFSCHLSRQLKNSYYST